MAFFFLIEIPLLCVGVMLWIFCCYYVKQKRKSEEEVLVCRESPSVYVIPLCDEEQDTCDACYGQSYRESTQYSLRQNRLEPPSYIDDAPPSYSDLFRDSTGRTVP